MKHRRVKKKPKFSAGKRAAIFIVSLLVLVIAFIAVMSFGSIFAPDGDEEAGEETVVRVDKGTGKINVLAIGLDNDGYRTDTILIASYDLDNDKVNILSIPRDTRMYVGGNYQKINCAYAITKNGKRNGVNGTIEAVTRLTAIPINYYVEFTFETFREVVDALGGVDFDVPQNMNYDDPVQNLHIHLKKGFQHLDGDKAEQFVRFRKYPMGDIDRVKAQQNFIKALAEQKLNASVITKLPDIFKVLKKDVKTNLTPSEIAKYAVNLMDLSSENVNSYSLPGVSDSESYGASYWVVNIAETKKLIEETFGYDASGITIHSRDGKSIVKDVKLVKKGTEETKEDDEKTVEKDSKVTDKDTKKNTDSKKATEPQKEQEKETPKEAGKEEKTEENNTKNERKRPKPNQVTEDEQRGE